MKLAEIAIWMLMPLYIIVSIIGSWVNVTGFENSLSLLISIGAFIFTALSFAYRVSPSMSARMDTQRVPFLDTREPATFAMEVTNNGGDDKLLRGQQYLDLILINGGPGVARDVTWRLEIIGYKENESGLTGALPILESEGKANVIGLLKKYDANKEKIENSFKKEQKLESKDDLSDEQEKDIFKRSRIIEKYRLHLCYKSSFTSRKSGFELSFNEDGGFIKQAICKCSSWKKNDKIPDSPFEDTSRIARSPLMAESASNFVVAIATVVLGLYYNIPHYFGWVAILVIILNFVLGGVLLSAYPNKGLEWWVSGVRKVAKKSDWIRHQSSEFVFFILLGSFGIAVGLSNLSAGLERFEFTKSELLSLIDVVAFAVVAIGLGLLTSSLPKRNSKQLTPIGFLVNVALLLAIITSLFSAVLYVVRALSGPLFYVTVIALLVCIFLGSDALSREFPRKP